MFTAFGYYHDPHSDYYRYIREIEARWPEPERPPSAELMEIVEEAIDRCPHMTDLWLRRAELIQRCGADSPYEPGDALAGLEAAARIEPDNIAAHEAIAVFCEDMADDLPRAERAYLRAVDLHGGPWVYTGLARVLAKQGRFDEAAAALDPDFCPYGDEPGVEEARRRLAEGEVEF